MTKIDLARVPAYYQKYVNQVLHLEVLEALEFSCDQFVNLVSSLPNDKFDFAYAPGKWTIKELLCHIIDAERIFAYRALCFSRNDKTNLPGFDENAYVPESNANSRTPRSIVEEFSAVRAASITLFKNLDEEAWLRSGTANNTEISVLALGYVVSGHLMHHISVLKERYLS